MNHYLKMFILGIVFLASGILLVALPTSLMDFFNNAGLYHKYKYLVVFGWPSILSGITLVIATFIDFLRGKIKKEEKEEIFFSIKPKKIISTLLILIGLLSIFFYFSMVLFGETTGGWLMAFLFFFSIFSVIGGVVLRLRK